MTPDTYNLFSSVLHWGVGALLAIAVLSFVWQFVLSGHRTGRELRAAQQRLTALKKEGPVLDLDRVESEVMRGKALRHCWAEYRDTLHGQKQANAQGVLEVRRWRATSLASNFFTEQALVDTPLRTEFYKHLPGILTGLGIIGTFSGLILGLQGFKVSDDASVVRGSLETLIGSVGGAFVLSGAAITLAMLVTTIEKFIVNSRYIQVEALCGLIDSLFDAGAGEEYLQRLVEASETSATQAMQMKESLVTDLKQVLTELTQQQIAMMQATSTQLGQAITSSLTEGLTEPLTRISDAVQSVGNSQGEAVNKLLTDVLGSFTEQMQGMFGSQMRGMNEMLVQTANTIQTTSQRFEQLASQIQNAGSGAADAMAKRMEEALQQMQARQLEANDQMRAFVDQLKDSVARGQSESAELTLNMMKELTETTASLVKGLQEQSEAAQRTHSAQQADASERMHRLIEQMQASVARGQSESAEAIRLLLSQLGDTTGTAVRSLQEQMQASQQADASRHAQAAESMRGLIGHMQESVAKGQSESAEATRLLLSQLGDTTSSVVQDLQAQMRIVQQEHASRQADLTEKTAQFMGYQSEQVSRLTDTVQQASSAMRDAIERLQSTTQESLERMGTGAERLLGASSRLGDNLDRMKTNSDGLNSMADKLTGSASTLDNVLTAAQQALADQRSVRDALMNMVGDLRATIENAKREASVTSDLVDSLQTASQRLTEAQRTADTYLQGVTEVLAEAHGAFAKQMEITLREGNRTFHQELAQATGLLKGAIQDLGDVLDNVPARA